MCANEAMLKSGDEVCLCDNNRGRICRAALVNCVHIQLWSLIADAIGRVHNMTQRDAT